jgi:D-serine deaminase-like pyridoxal phosphate-dependent protein
MALTLDALDTPAMLVDMDAMERNIARFMALFRGGPVSVRPHLKTLKSPLLARCLLDAGARGVCVAKLSEAQVMLGGGIDDILITTELAGGPKLARLVALLGEFPHARLRLVVDGAAGADALASALSNAGLRARVLLDVDVGQRRCGVLPGEPARALARHVARLPGLQLCGVQGYEGHLQQLVDAAERERLCREALGLLVATAAELRADGHDMTTVTTGGTGTALICGSYPGVTEVQPGSFVFMDASYSRAVAFEHELALTLLSTVISRPRPGEAVIDAGLKTLSTDSGPALPKGPPGWCYRPAGDEHGILSWDATCTRPEPRVGERLELVPSHIDTTVNLHDEYWLVRGGVLEGRCAVSARGKVQ